MEEYDALERQKRRGLRQNRTQVSELLRSELEKNEPDLDRVGHFIVELELFWNKLTEADEKMSATNPLKNDLILQEVMSFLPLSSLKAARLVNHAWKDAATPPFVQKHASKIQLNISGELRPT